METEPTILLIDPIELLSDRQKTIIFDFNKRIIISSEKPNLFQKLSPFQADLYYMF